MNHQVRVPDDVAQFIRSLHPTIKRKVRAALQIIAKAPTCGKPLKEELSGLRSYRLGRFRIVYRIAENLLIELVMIGPRKHIYEETYRKVCSDNQ